MRTKKDCIAPIKQSNIDIGKNLSVVIPCARCGKNLKYKGNKSLFKIGEDTLLEHQIKTIRKVFPECEIIVIVGEEALKIKKTLYNKYENVRLIYNSVHDTHNILYSIGLGVYNRLYNRVLIIYGDLLFNRYAIDGITLGSSKLLIDINNVKKNNKIGIITLENKIHRLTYGILPKWGQMIYLENKELRLFDICSLKNPNWCGHEGINYIIESGGLFLPFINTGYNLLEISSLEDLDTIQRIKQ